MVPCALNDTPRLTREALKSGCLHGPGGCRLSERQVIQTSAYSIPNPLSATGSGAEAEKTRTRWFSSSAKISLPVSESTDIPRAGYLSLFCAPPAAAVVKSVWPKTLSESGPLAMEAALLKVRTRLFRACC